MADLSELGQVALELLEDVSERADEGDFEVGQVMIVAELTNETHTIVTTRCTEDRAWVKLGLLEAAALYERAVLTPEVDDGD